MSWATAVSDLRVKLSDGPTDKLRAFKRVLGDTNGTNTTFKTFEFRRVTDFVAPSGSGYAGVYVNGTIVSVAFDEPSSGYFVLNLPPASGAVVEATYHVQYFLDSELDEFMRLSCNWLLAADDYTQIPAGLHPAALQYAMADAYGKLAMRFAEHLSETFRMEDTPDPKRFEMVAQYKQAAQEARDMAHKLRDEYYKRQGQHLSPLFGTSVGKVRDTAPNR